MKRTQIYLTDKEEEGILTIIKKNGGGTKAEHIRRALDDYIDKYNQIRIPINTNLDFNWIPQEKVEKLEKEIAALESAYKSKFISEESYTKQKQRIESELQKLKKS